MGQYSPSPPQGLLDCTICRRSRLAVSFDSPVAERERDPTVTARSARGIESVTVGGTAMQAAA